MHLYPPSHRNSIARTIPLFAGLLISALPAVAQIRGMTENPKTATSPAQFRSLSSVPIEERAAAAATAKGMVKVLIAQNDTPVP
ncbi:MAG TPA: hypothetical protein VK956_12070, partial [Verrucomicrobium sp.]|nr:hypothetical protein [Verrucomicrobium sp.]